MTTLGWLLLLVVALIVSYFAERELARRRGTPSVTQTLNRRWRRAVASPKQSQTDDFRVWIRETLADDDPLRHWLLDLPSQSWQALTAQLRRFLRELNIDLVWLSRAELDADPALRAEVKQIVISFCTACMEATSAQPGLEEVRRFQTALEHLTDREQRTVARRLLSELREESLVSTAEPDMLLASDTQRRAYVQQMIEEATAKDQTRFQMIFERVLTENR